MIVKARKKRATLIPHDWGHLHAGGRQGRRAQSVIVRSFFADEVHIMYTGPGSRGRPKLYAFPPAQFQTKAALILQGSNSPPSVVAQETTPAPVYPSGAGSENSGSFEFKNRVTRHPLYVQSAHVKWDCVGPGETAYDNASMWGRTDLLPPRYRFVRRCQEMYRSDLLPPTVGEWNQTSKRTRLRYHL